MLKKLTTLLIGASVVNAICTTTKSYKKKFTGGCAEHERLAISGDHYRANIEKTGGLTNTVDSCFKKCES